MAVPPGIHTIAYVGAIHLPHYGRWAAAIGVTILVITVLVVTISALRTGGRRRR